MDIWFVGWGGNHVQHNRSRSGARLEVQLFAIKILGEFYKESQLYSGHQQDGHNRLKSICDSANIDGLLFLCRSSSWKSKLRKKIKLILIKKKKIFSTGFTFKQTVVCKRHCQLSEIGVAILSGCVPVATSERANITSLHAQFEYGIFLIFNLIF